MDRVSTDSKTVKTGKKGGPRYTDIFVTVNTNRKPYSRAEESSLYDELEGIVRDKLMTEEGLRAGLPMADPNKIMEVTMPMLSLETGKKPRGGRVHAHFILNIVHSTNFILKVANAHMKKWFDKQFSWFTGENGCNVHVRLLGTSKLKNYIAKSGRAPPAHLIDDFQ